MSCLNWTQQSRCSFTFPFVLLLTDTSVWSMSERGWACILGFYFHFLLYLLVFFECVGIYIYIYIYILGVGID